MPPFMQIEVDQNITQAFDALERELDRELRQLASETGVAIKHTIQASIARNEGVLAGNFVSEDDEKATRVFARPIGRPANLPQWLEFGTRTMTARPAIQNAVRLHKGRFARQAESKVRQVVSRVERGHRG